MMAMRLDLRVFLWAFLSDRLFKVVVEPVVINDGGVFGWGREWGWEAMGLVVLGMVALWWQRSWNTTERTGLALVFAGGLSNVMDRWLYDGVRDFIFWPILNVYGNVADIWLTLGGLLVLWSVRVKPSAV